MLKKIKNLDIKPLIMTLFILSTVNIQSILANNTSGIKGSKILPISLEHITQEVKDEIIQDYLSKKQTEFTINTAQKSIAKKIKLLKIVLTGAAALFTVHICIKIYLNYKNGQEIYKLLQKFNSNPNYTYENLTIDSRNLYYKLSLNPSSVSLSNDYPVSGYLEKSATEIKNFLSPFFFFHDLSTLSKNLERELKIIRANSDFQKERKEFNEKYRQQAFRNFITLIPVIK